MIAKKLVVNKPRCVSHFFFQFSIKANLCVDILCKYIPFHLFSLLAFKYLHDLCYKCSLFFFLCLSAAEKTLDPYRTASRAPLRQTYQSEETCHETTGTLTLNLLETKKGKIIGSLISL